MLWCCSSKASRGCYPPEEESNEEEQTYFWVYFIGFLDGLFESMSAISIGPFVFHVPAAGVVFGYSKSYCGRWFGSHWISST